MGDRPVKLPARFWAKVQASPTGCWLWTAAVDGCGYGMFLWQGKTRRTHVLAWEELVGPRTPGLELDHLCKTRPCLNPDCLEEVTHAENVRRGLAGSNSLAKNHCAAGHPFDAANTYVWAARPTWRVCRACQAAHARRRREA